MDQNTYTLVMVVIFVGFIYFAIFRPESKRKKEAQKLQDGLKKGDIITSVAGIVGKIVEVKESTIIIETSEDRVRMEMTKWAVASVGLQTSEMPEPAKKAEKKEAGESENGEEEES